MRIYVPTSTADDWQRLLAEPDLHWKKGFSARSLAYAWEQGKERGFPPEIAAVFTSSNVPAFQQLTPLLALPEYQVMLPGGGRPSQNDLFVLAKAGDGQLVSIMVEGKVSESFDKTIAQWYAKPSLGKQDRLEFLQQTLGLASALPQTIRYQLLHRTVSAVLEAVSFNASYAVMLVHSFSSNHMWFEDYQAFAQLFGVQVALNSLAFVKTVQGVDLYLGWAQGEARFLEM